MTPRTDRALRALLDEGVLTRAEYEAKHKLIVLGPAPFALGTRVRILSTTGAPKGTAVGRNAQNGRYEVECDDGNLIVNISPLNMESVAGP